MHPSLVGQVRQVRVIEGLRSDTMIERMPDGSTGMLLRMLGDGVGDVSVAGPRTRALFKRAPPAELALFVEFEPGAGVPFLGVPPHTIADRYARIEDVWGSEGSRVRDRLLASRTPTQARTALEQALADRLRASPSRASTRLARRAVARLSSCDMKIESLAAELGVSTRHLRRVFTEAVGVTPKAFARIVRLQRALAPAMRSSSWTERALEAGYYDQAHFIAEFRDLVGTTPARFSRREPAWPTER